MEEGTLFARDAVLEEVVGQRVVVAQIGVTLDGQEVVDLLLGLVLGSELRRSNLPLGLQVEERSHLFWLRR